VAPRVKSAQPTRALAISVAAEHSFGGDPRKYADSIPNSAAVNRWHVLHGSGFVATCSFLPAKNYKLLWRPMPADGGAAERFVKVCGEHGFDLTCVS
jgi:hypothetical protein